MFVGGHYLYPDQAFRGSLRDVKLWNQEVAWPTLENARASLVLVEETDDDGCVARDESSLVLAFVAAAGQDKDVSTVSKPEGGYCQAH